ncbi:hypothetical protein I4U23_005739 [Adineta vaga]|nr:hypothetical protein I4U23_005739 [Adineta vaga]
MTTNDKIVQIPMSVRDIDECNPYFLLIKNDLYKNFVVFGQIINGLRKNAILKRAQKFLLLMVIKKPIDWFASPIQMGCLYSPLRRAPGIDHRYCQHHQPATLEENDRMTHMTPEIINEDKEQVLDKLALSDYINDDGQYDNKICNVFRSGVNVKCKISTYGFLATFLSCAVIVGFTELPCSEGSWLRRVLHHILTIKRFGQLPIAMCYDCACTLKLFIKKHFGTEDLKSTNFTQFLTDLTMAIDRFHVKNHTRQMCKTVMRPDHSSHHDVFKSINTQVAEQMFSYLSQFKNSFRGYNYPKSTIFFTVLFHLKNCKTTGIDSYDQAL